jgi:hypothetical protein
LHEAGIGIARLKFRETWSLADQRITCSGYSMGKRHSRRKRMHKTLQ